MRRCQFESKALPNSRCVLARSFLTRSLAGTADLSLVDASKEDLDAMLELLGFRRSASVSEQVAILVGPNGAGKSNFLKGLAQDLRHSRNLAVICNTAYDRFAGMRGIRRVSASRSGRSPKGVIKLAVAQTLDEEDGRFYQIGTPIIAVIVSVSALR